MAIGNYVLKKPAWRIAANAVDRVGYALRKPVPSKRFLLDRVLVVRLDQLGDIVQTLPFFDGLKASFPRAQIDFLTTPAGAELFRLARPEINIVGSDAIAGSAYDCAFDLRGDIRLICKLRKGKSKVIVGYGATGAGFLLDVEPEWVRGLHAIDKNLKLLEAVGGKAITSFPRIEVGGGKRSAGTTFAIHPDAGTPAKKWPVERFVSVIDRIQAEQEARIVLVGLDKKIGDDIERMVKKSVDNQMGKTTLTNLIALLSGCDGLLTNDSGPAHLMAALGKPVWVIWSGTADPKIWAPRGSGVTLFEHPVACAPCSRRHCNIQDHPCLTEISPVDVAASLISHARRT